MGVIASDSHNFNLFSLVHLSHCASGNSGDPTMKAPGSRLKNIKRSKSDAERINGSRNEVISHSELGHKASLGSIYFTKELK